VSGECVRVDVEQLRGEIQPLAESIGVELVALEWLQSPGRGVLRLYIDRPGGDPRVKPDDANPGTTADQCAAVSHAVSKLLDDGDRIEVAYDLEVSSPGFERLVQQRKDFDRFAGLEIKVRTRGPLEGKTSFEGTLIGTAGDGDEYTVRVSSGGREVAIPRRQVSRARLLEIKAPKPVKPGKGPKAPRPPKSDGVAKAAGDESPEAGR
jgi:ribosome maturation factor RimP